MESRPQEHSAREGSTRGGAPPDAANEVCEAEVSGYRAAEAANDQRMAQLVRTIEQQIIPRLMLAHRTATEPLAPSSGGGDIGEHDVESFTKLVLSQDEDAAFATVQTLRARDVAVDKIYLDLLAPTARYLGALWEDDLCSFTDVTVGLGRLQRVLRELSPALGPCVEKPAQGRRVLLLPSPGEQHTFGLVMVAEFFRQAGWDVTGGSWVAGADASALVSGEWFDVIGFSLAAEVHLPALTSSITAVRHATCNRQIAVLVGGPLFATHPEFAQQVGADGMTIDGREAPSLANRLVVDHARQHGVPG